MWIFGESAFQAERRDGAREHSRQREETGQEPLQCLDNRKLASVAKESKRENGGSKIKEVTIWSY